MKNSSVEILVINANEYNVKKSYMIKNWKNFINFNFAAFNDIELYL